MKPGWEVKALGEVATIINGGTPKSEIPAYWDGDIDWLTPKDMGKLDGHLVHVTPRRISREGLAKCSARQVPAQSVIMSTRAPIGHLAMNTVPMAFNQGCRGMVPGDKLDAKYLFYVLSANVQALDDLGTGTTFKELSAGSLKAFRIPLPPLDEQKRIVEVLDAAFEGLSRARAHTETNLQNARELFEQSLDEVLSTQSADWRETTLGEIYDVRDGTHDSPAYVESGHALITSKNLGRDGLHFEKVKFISNEDFLSISKRSAVHTGDVLFAMIGTIGNPIVVEIEPSFAIKNVALFKMKDGRNGHFLRYFLTSKRTVEKMMAEAKGTTQQFVGLGYLRSFPIRAPSPDEEGIFVAKFRTLEELSQQLESHYRAKLADLDALRQALLQKAFAGELT